MEYIFINYHKKNLKKKKMSSMTTIITCGSFTFALIDCVRNFMLYKTTRNKYQINIINCKYFLYREYSYVS